MKTTLLWASHSLWVFFLWLLVAYQQTTFAGSPNSVAGAIGVTDSHGQSWIFAWKWFDCAINSGVWCIDISKKYGHCRPSVKKIDRQTLRDCLASLHDKMTPQTSHAKGGNKVHERYHRQQETLTRTSWTIPNYAIVWNQNMTVFDCKKHKYTRYASL